jgi:hypothetical protein
MTFLTTNLVIVRKLSHRRRSYASEHLFMMFILARIYFQ